MTRTQILIPDNLYVEVKRYADLCEISMAEVVRSALDLFVNIHRDAHAVESDGEWTFPVSAKDDAELVDPFLDEDWRCRLHMRENA